MPMLLPAPILPELGHSCDCGIRRSVTCFHIEGNACYLKSYKSFCVCKYILLYNRIPRTLSVLFCPCESDAVKLTKLHYWPGTPTRPSVAFSFSLLNWLEALLLECQVALHDATEAMAFLIKEKIEQVCMHVHGII